MSDVTRADLHLGLCRRCLGTGMTTEPSGRVPCADCQGAGCLA